MVGAVNFYEVVVWGIAVGGIGFVTVVICGVLIALKREDKDRPLVPWGARMRVEKAKAGLELDAIEVKRLAVDHQRTLVLRAMQNGEDEKVAQLALGGGEKELRGDRY